MKITNTQMPAVIYSIHLVSLSPFVDSLWTDHEFSSFAAADEWCEIFNKEQEACSIRLFRAVVSELPDEPYEEAKAPALVFDKVSILLLLLGAMFTLLAILGAFQAARYLAQLF